MELATPELDEKMTWIYRKDAYKRCSFCNASKVYQEIRMWMPLWQDGHVFCNNCDAYLGDWDGKVKELISA